MWVNHAFTTMTGYSKEEAVGKHPRLLKSGKQPEGYYANLWSTISSGKVWKDEIVNRTPSTLRTSWSPPRVTIVKD